jgi:outer membrane receptor protein involved in Fe transport
MGTDIQSVSAVTFNDAGIQRLINIGSNAANQDGIVAAAFPNLPAGATGSAIVTRAQGVYRDLSFYFQDTWRMRQNFTLNIGVRYERSAVFPNRLQPHQDHDHHRESSHPVEGELHQCV